MLTAIAPSVADITVLSPAEADGIVQQLFRLRSHWIMRNLYAPFYTLGAASYMDAIGATAWRYKAWTPDQNKVLRENFAPLYDRVLRAIEQWTGERAQYAADLALPGFHIYLSSPLFEKPIASIHFDSQFNLHQWPTDADLENPISFTLSVALPKTGGGLITWDLPKSEVAGKTINQVAAMTRAHASEFHPYAVGHIAAHSGNLLHRAAPSRELSADDMRITLQGHGVRVNGTWQLYW